MLRLKAYCLIQWQTTLVSSSRTRFSAHPRVDGHKLIIFVWNSQYETYTLFNESAAVRILLDDVTGVYDMMSLKDRREVD